MSNDYQIVAGVDGPPASRAALRWALWHAGLVSGRITALRAWDYPELYDWPLSSTDDVTHTTAKALTDTVREVADDTAVHVDAKVVPGRPAKALLHAAEETAADILVVGNRGHGGFVGALQGSVSQYCVQHAHCPVVVVREAQD